MLVLGCPLMRFLAADDWIRDTRHGLRALWRAPAFTLVATLTLGLGVGAVTVIYSVVYNVVVSPLPHRDADRLVNVMVEDARSGRVRGTFSFAELEEFSAQTNAFEDVIGGTPSLLLRTAGSPTSSLKNVRQELAAVDRQVAVVQAASFASNRLLTTQLWDVSPNDPLTLTAATILVASIACAACYLPARRAMRVDPIVALRED